MEAFFVILQRMETPVITPALYLLPVGLSDAPASEVVPAYNVEIMKGIRYFIVENVRTARRWIRRCDPSFSFEGVEFYELNNHTESTAITKMLDPLRQGQPVGVMSEAGCPAVADPGSDVVAIAQREGLKVVPLVGPSSILMSLMGSGFNGQSFCFHGYLPIDEKQKREELLRLEWESGMKDRTQIFIETPYRNNRMLELILNVLAPDTLVCVACEITDRTREEIRTLTVAEWRKTTYDYGKRPAIFLIYRKGEKGGMKFAERGGRKKR